MNQPSEDIKRWTARRKAAAIIEIIKGKTAAAELARSHALTVAEIERWMDDFVSAIDCCTREVLGYALKRHAELKPPSAPWKKPCSPALAHCVVPLRTCCFAMTTAGSLDRDSIAPW